MPLVHCLYINVIELREVTHLICPRQCILTYFDACKKKKKQQQIPHKLILIDGLLVFLVTLLISKEADLFSFRISYGSVARKNK